MPKAKILIQLDPDKQASTFDSVVAVDSEVDQLFRHQDVKTEEVESLVHGAIFTRGPGDLKSTAIFVGGNDVQTAEKILEKCKSTFFGPMRVSIMLDANGCNTTAVAAVLKAQEHVDLSGNKVAVLGGTGPVGQRIAQLCAQQGAEVLIGSRKLAKATATSEKVKAIDSSWQLKPFSTEQEDWQNAIQDAQVLFGAGAAGAELIDADRLASLHNTKVLVDLNAVPPAGIAGVDVMASGQESNGRKVYGAIGVGGLKMKIHKACIRQLFESNDQVLEAEAIYNIGSQL